MFSIWNMKQKPPQSFFKIFLSHFLLPAKITHLNDCFMYTLEEHVKSQLERIFFFEIFPWPSMAPLGLPWPSMGPLGMPWPSVNCTGVPVRDVIALWRILFSRKFPKNSYHVRTFNRFVRSLSYSCRNCKKFRLT